jgi:hydroxyacylglutathione hydrolase
VPVPISVPIFLAVAPEERRSFVWRMKNGWWWLVALGCLFGSVATASAQDFRLSASDGWHELSKMAPGTWAISEPRSAMRNVSYVIEGAERAILFDTGTGRDITAMVTAATRLPVTVIPSHGHHDHVGSIERFDHIALPDIAAYRERTIDGVWSPTISTSLSLSRPSVGVDEWIAPGTAIELGGRTLVLIAMPGHSPDSVALVEPAAQRLFSGDFLFPGHMRLYLPGSDVSAFRDSVAKLQQDFPGIEHVHGGHGAPWMAGSSIGDLEQALDAIAEGTAEGSRQWWLAGMATRYAFDDFAIVAP